jgi:hypothetical protein
VAAAENLCCIATRHNGNHSHNVASHDSIVVVASVQCRSNAANGVKSCLLFTFNPQTSVKLQWRTYTNHRQLVRYENERPEVYF